MVIHAVSVWEKLSNFVKELDEHKETLYELEVSFIKDGFSDEEKTVKRLKHAQVFVVAANAMEASDQNWGDADELVYNMPRNAERTLMARKWLLAWFLEKWSIQH